MNIYQIQVEDFLSKVANSSVLFNEELLKVAGVSIEKALKKTLGEDPNRPFSYRLSSIGRPLCQLQKDKAGEKGLPNDYSFPVKMLYGAIIEQIVTVILKEAGLNVESEQEHVTLDVAVSDKEVLTIPGTLDMIIDGKVWDIKSISPFLFDRKISDYRQLKENDSFGYIPQLFGYAIAKGISAGGWIFVNKSNGEFKVLECPEYQDAERKEAMATIVSNTTALWAQEEFKKCFTAKNEYFRKKPTGNQYLGSPCIFCKHRTTCWPEAKYMANPSSSAREPEYKYYTHIENKSAKS